MNFARGSACRSESAGCGTSRGSPAHGAPSRIAWGRDSALTAAGFDGEAALDLSLMNHAQ